MKRFETVAALFFALAFSLWLGRAESRTDDMGIIAGLIAAGGFLLSMVEPRYPWLWGLMVPAGIVAFETWNYFYGSRDPGTGGVGGLCGIAAFTIAIAGAGSYAGAFVRRRLKTA